MNGIINIYKERGYTSHDVVAKTRGILKTKKVGHTGTLDPEAEGVLPICVGRATKVAEYLTNKSKRYTATVYLGVTTTTEDATGDIIETKDVNVTEEEITKVVTSFIGEYMQVPPMYSALKINGKKLYELARQGLEVERKARKVTIYDCTITNYKLPHEFTIDVKCSKGTYIRTLCTDIGVALGCGAHMKDLVRTQVGDFDISNSITLSQLEELKKDNNTNSYLLPIEQIFSDLPQLHVKESANKYLYNGNQLKENMIFEKINLPFNTRVRIYDFKNVFIGTYIYKKVGESIYFVPEKIFFIP